MTIKTHEAPAMIKLAPRLERILSELEACSDRHSGCDACTAKKKSKCVTLLDQVHPERDISPGLAELIRRVIREW